ncbi:MAG: hypothetical protein IJR17_01140 [Clostridia bacterium]|nr:hypothetical protein [Clostridia bacterium]
MKETKFYQKALNMSLLDGKAVKAVLDEQIGKEPAKTQETAGFPWRRAGMVMAAVLVLFVTTILAIPSTRAEVLSLLGIISRPQDYLTADPSARPSIEVLDNMITTAKPEDTQVKVLPIDRTDSQAVNSEGALKVAELLQRDVRITLGDTLFDGDTAYVSLRLGGTAALPLLDSWTGGGATLVKVDPQRMYDFFEGGPGEEYLSGKKALYSRPESEIILVFADGSRASQFLNQSETEAFKAHIAALEAKDFHWDDLLPKERDEIDRMNRAFLEHNEVVATTQITDVREMLKRNADENGTVSAKAYFNVFVEEDYDLPATELLNVEVGTVRFNVTGYQSMETRAAETDGKKVVWKGDTVITYMELVDPEDHDKAATDWNNAVQMYTNYPVSLDGMTMEALPGAHGDDLGIYDLDMRITLPDSMEGNARKAWTNLVSMLPIDFKVLIDGQEGNWYHGGFGLTPNDDGTLTFHIVDIRGLNLETIKDIRTVTLIPVLRYVSGFKGPNNAYVELPLDVRTENPKTDDGVYMGQKFQRTEYPQYALTFTLR